MPACRKLLELVVKQNRELYLRRVAEQRIKLVINPGAGRGRTEKLLPRVMDCLSQKGLSYQFVMTQRSGDGFFLARQAVADGFGIVVAVGGDGTVNEVASALVDSAAALAVVPTGHGNDFFRGLGIPLNLDWACAVLKDAHCEYLDVGQINGQYFFNEVGIGLLAEAARFARAVKWGRGTNLYLQGLFKALKSFEPLKVVIKIDQVHLERLISFLAIGNGCSTGGGFRLTPDASFTDGLLDLCVVDKTNVLTVVRHLPKARTGTHTRLDITRVFRGRNIEILSEVPLPVHVDGEIMLPPPKHLQLTVHPQRLRVITPPLAQSANNLE